VLVWFAGNTAALIVSLITILWYNGVYTYLKRITALAVIPGAFTGALPPLIGWMAAGGNPFDITIILVQVLFFHRTDTPFLAAGSEIRTGIRARRAAEPYLRYEQEFDLQDDLPVCSLIFSNHSFPGILRHRSQQADLRDTDVTLVHPGRIFLYPDDKTS
jgi:hypothetical protein